MIRRSDERGFANHGWLKSFHTFSFADYFDPRYTGYGVLRVINEDTVVGGAGFGTHAHSNMEIISYVLSGALTHKDSMGNGSTLRYGDVQRMSAGSGVRHSEFNASPTEPVHFLQIWIKPNVIGAKPSYEERHYDTEDKRGKLRLIVSPNGADGSLSMHQDGKVYAGLFDDGDAAELTVALNRAIYVQVAKGDLEANGERLATGDALQFSGIQILRIASGSNAEVLVFELPAVAPG